MKHAEEIAAAYEQGVALADICEEFGIHPPEVYRAVRSLGVPLRSSIRPVTGLGGQERSGVPKHPSTTTTTTTTYTARKRWPEIYGKDTYARVVMLYQNGTPGKKIAGDLGIRYNHVLSMLHDASVEVIPGRGIQKYRDVRDEVIKAFRMPGIALEDICIEFGITMDVVYRMVRFEPEVVRMREDLAGSNGTDRVEVIVEEVLRRFKERIAIEGGLGIQVPIVIQLPLF
jgi:hypothetical protein